MLCSFCDVEMRIVRARYELSRGEHPEVTLVQELSCPKCGRNGQARHVLEVDTAD